MAGLSSGILDLYSEMLARVPDRVRYPDGLASRKRASPAPVLCLFNCSSVN